jgi:hypothetical protein
MTRQLFKALILLGLIGQIALAQTSYIDTALNVEYQPPPGWTLGNPLVDYMQKSFLPTKPGRGATLRIDIQRFDDTLHRDQAIYKGFLGAITGAYNVSTIAPTIRYFTRETKNSIQYFGVEIVGSTDASALFVQMNKNFAFSVLYDATVADWTANREEYYQHFQGLSFIQVNKTVALKRSASYVDQAEAKSALLKDALGRSQKSAAKLPLFLLPQQSGIR